jgi:hypothetical protein
VVGAAAGALVGLAAAATVGAAVATGLGAAVGAAVATGGLAGAGLQPLAITTMSVVTNEMPKPKTLVT